MLEEGKQMVGTIEGWGGATKDTEELPPLPGGGTVLMQERQDQHTQVL
jgi:hypothetical protein